MPAYLLQESLLGLRVEGLGRASTQIEGASRDLHRLPGRRQGLLRVCTRCRLRAANGCPPLVVRAAEQCWLALLFHVAAGRRYAKSPLTAGSWAQNGPRSYERDHRLLIAFRRKVGETRPPLVAPFPGGPPLKIGAARPMAVVRGAWFHWISGWSTSPLRRRPYELRPLRLPSSKYRSSSPRHHSQPQARTGPPQRRASLCTVGRESASHNSEFLAPTHLRRNVCHMETLLEHQARIPG